MKNTITLLLVALLATGCASEVPRPSTFPLTSQHKIKSAHHWDVIASLAKNNLGNTPITVSTQQPDAPFHTGFRTFLITHLVDSNQPVIQKGSDVEVQFETQIVRHVSERRATTPGQLTMLTAGILVLRNAAIHWNSDQQALGALALAGLADWGAGQITPVTKTEVIVTTSVTRKGQFLMRKTDVYYVEDADGALFEQMKQWRVVG